MNSPSSGVTTVSTTTAGVAIVPTPTPAVTMSPMPTEINATPSMVAPFGDEVVDRQAMRNQVYEDIMFEMNEQIQLAEKHLKELNGIIQRIRTMKDVADNLYYK